jgi:hypothetical protein
MVTLPCQYLPLLTRDEFKVGVEDPIARASKKATRARGLRIRLFYLALVAAKVTGIALLVVGGQRQQEQFMNNSSIYYTEPLVVVGGVLLGLSFFTLMLSTALLPCCCRWRLPERARKAIDESRGDFAFWKEKGVRVEFVSEEAATLELPIEALTALGNQNLSALQPMANPVSAVDSSWSQPSSPPLTLGRTVTLSYVRLTFPESAPVPPEAVLANVGNGFFSLPGIPGRFAYPSFSPVPGKVIAPIPGGTTADLGPAQNIPTSNPTVGAMNLQQQMVMGLGMGMQHQMAMGMQQQMAMAAMGGGVDAMGGTMGGMGGIPTAIPVSSAPMDNVDGPAQLHTYYKPPM